MNPPEEIHHVSHGFFSVARYYGGCTFNNASYTYFPDRDVLIRDDVLRRRAAEERKAKKAAKTKAAKPKQRKKGAAP